MPKKINVVGWFHKNNIGDQAFIPAMEKIFQGHTIEYITPPQSHTNPDIAVLGGGAVASPYYLNVLPNNCPRYALGIDLAYESEIDLLINANFQGVMMRNQTDVNQWKQKSNCPIWCIPDLAFMLQPSYDNKILKSTHPKKVGVFATDYVNPAIDRPVSKCGNRAYSFAINLAKELDTLAAQGWEVYLLCCSTGGYGDDRRMALQLASFMESKPIVMLDTFTPQEMIDLIAQLQLTVCQRFHAHIFSIIAGTPLVSIEFTRKVKILLEEMKIKYDVSCARFEGETFNTSRFQKTVNFVLEKGYSRSFRTIAGQNRNKLLEAIKIIRQCWLQESP